MATESAVCYVCDLDFLLPSLISATGVRRFISPQKADIFVYVIHPDGERINAINNSLRTQNICVQQMSHQLFDDIDWTRSNKTHVPLPALGRFFLDTVLPPAYKTILYLDGDTWIRRDVTTLIEMPLSGGTLAAAEDISYFCVDDLTSYGSFIRRYYDGLGLNRRTGYFNSGVLAVSRETWRTLAAEALSFFKANIEACKFHDQSALNAVIGDRRLRLSPEWNFQTPYRYWGVENEIDPAIYHFTGGPKPWSGAVDPWSELYSLYQHEIHNFAPLGLPIEKLETGQIEEANARSLRQRQRLKYLLRYQLWSRRRKLRHLTSA